MELINSYGVFLKHFLAIMEKRMPAIVEIAVAAMAGMIIAEGLALPYWLR